MPYRRQDDYGVRPLPPDLAKHIEPDFQQREHLLSPIEDDQEDEQQDSNTDMEQAELAAAGEGTRWGDRPFYVPDKDDGLIAPPPRWLVETADQAAWARHEAERDAIIEGHKIRTDDPEYTVKLIHRDAALYAHDNVRTETGDEPEEGFIPPETEQTYVPAPKVATGYSVQVKRYRAHRRGDRVRVPDATKVTQSTSPDPPLLRING
jgi:hypothetical protein